MPAANKCNWQMNWQCIYARKAPLCPDGATCPTYDAIINSNPASLDDVCKMMYSCDESGHCNTCTSKGIESDKELFTKMLDKNSAKCFEVWNYHDRVNDCCWQKGLIFEHFNDFCTPQHNNSM